MSRRPDEPRAFLSMPEDDLECGDDLRAWERDYVADLVAGGLTVPLHYADVPQPAQH